MNIMNELTRAQAELDKEGLKGPCVLFSVSTQRVNVGGLTGVSLTIIDLLSIETSSWTLISILTMITSSESNN